MLALDLLDFGWNVIAVLVALGLRDVAIVLRRHYRRRLRRADPR